jgi:hypothetical protein
VFRWILESFGDTEVRDRLPALPADRLAYYHGLFEQLNVALTTRWQ